MGAKTKVVITVIVAAIGIGIVYLSPKLTNNKTVRKLFSNYINFFLYKPESPSSDSSSTEKLFTVEELRKYDGTGDSPGLYLAILGKVFDVQKGAQHYRPGGSYSFFAGRDATRAYVSGDFSEEGLVDDIDGLDSTSLLGIDDWLSFYQEEYSYIGKLIGRYYKEDGSPTEEYKKARRAIQNAKLNKMSMEKEKQLFPPCNSEWSKEKGTRVWCTDKSGGIGRDWVGVPRKFFKPGQTEPRCACIKNFGPPSGSSQNINDRGDLDNPNIQLYPGCPQDSNSCSWRD